MRYELDGGELSWLAQRNHVAVTVVIVQRSGHDGRRGQDVSRREREGRVLQGVTEKRRLGGVSRAEMERRWALTRVHMEEKQVDAVVALGSDNLTAGGYHRWLTDVPVTDYRRAVVFHLGDLMTIIDHGPTGGRRRVGDSDPDLPGVDEILSVTEIPSVGFSQRFEGEIVARDILDRGYRAIGLCGPLAMPHGFVSTLQAALEGKVDIVDVSDFIDLAKAVKSEEEITIMRRTARMQDAIFARLLERIEPGMRDSEASAIMQFEGRLLGAEEGIINAGSAPIGTKAMFRHPHFQGREFGRGDIVTVLLENNGPEGYYTEIVRSIVFGRATDEMRECFEIAREAQADGIARLRPGVPAHEILTANHEFMKARDLPVEMRVHCHSQGYDLVERPLARPEENMLLEAGMVMAIHPGVVTPTVFTTVCDDYLIGEDGAGACLHQTEKKIFEL